jgi:hypothetical protein
MAIRLQQLFDEIVQHADMQHERFSVLYGSKMYKCRNQLCRLSSSKAFTSQMERQRHEDRHTRPYKCPSEPCEYWQRGFASTAQLQKHIKSYHPKVDNDEATYLEVGFLGSLNLFAILTNQKSLL